MYFQLLHTKVNFENTYYNTSVNNYRSIEDLQSIFKRDIEDNHNFAFRSRFKYPIKADGEADMGRLFKHLTCEEITVEDEYGKKS